MITGHDTVLNVECSKCARKGRYRVHRLMEKYGRKGNLRRHGHSNTNAGANPIAFPILKQHLTHSKIIDILKEAYELAAPRNQFYATHPDLKSVSSSLGRSFVPAVPTNRTASASLFPCTWTSSIKVEGTLSPSPPKLVRILYEPAHGPNSGGFIKGCGPVFRHLSRQKAGHLSKVAIALGVTCVLQCAP